MRIYVNNTEYKTEIPLVVDLEDGNYCAIGVVDDKVHVRNYTFTKYRETFGEAEKKACVEFVRYKFCDWAGLPSGKINASVVDLDVPTVDGKIGFRSDRKDH